MVETKTRLSSFKPAGFCTILFHTLINSNSRRKFSALYCKRNDEMYRLGGVTETGVEFIPHMNNCKSASLSICRQTRVTLSD